MVNPQTTVQLLETYRAFQAILALKAAVVNPAVKFTVWRYEIEALSPSPNICKVCHGLEGDFYELEDPDDLLDMFPYGEWLDDDNFAVNQHPYCRCMVVRDHDVNW